MTVAGYVHFTEEQKQRANSVDLIYFLQQRGEKLLPSGREKRLDTDHSITVQGSRWYDHAAEEGGYAIDLVKRLYDLSFPDAVSLLLGGERGVPYQECRNPQTEPRKPFTLPEAHTDMRRVYAYLMKQRFIDRNVIYEFAKEKLLFEDKTYHNVVFVGMDEQGIPRHAHKKSTLTIGTGYRGNVEGSNPDYSFHYVSKNPAARTLLAFEAPIDLLSYISMNQKNWRNFHYVALNGVSEKSIIKLLNLNPGINHVILALDHDAAGIEASEKISDLLMEKAVPTVQSIYSQNKDWNEDLKAKHGLIVTPAEEHPQMQAKQQLSSEIEEVVRIFANFDITIDRIKDNFERCKAQHSRSEFETTKEYLKDLTALSIISAAAEYQKAGDSQTAETIQTKIVQGFRVYQNRGKLKNKMSDISNCLKSLFLLQKKELPQQTPSKAGAYEKLAGEFFRAVVLAECQCLLQKQAIGITENNQQKGLLLS